MYLCTLCIYSVQLNHVRIIYAKFEIFIECMLVGRVLVFEFETFLAFEVDQLDLILAI